MCCVHHHGPYHQRGHSPREEYMRGNHRSTIIGNSKCTVRITVKAARGRWLKREGLKADMMLNWFLRNALELSSKGVGKRHFQGKGKNAQRHRVITQYCQRTGN